MKKALLITTLIFSPVAYAEPQSCTLAEESPASWVILREGLAVSEAIAFTEATGLLANLIQRQICYVTAKTCDVRDMGNQISAIYRGPEQISRNLAKGNTYQKLYTLIEIGLCK